jgi:hypothetical protein
VYGSANGVFNLSESLFFDNQADQDSDFWNVNDGGGMLYADPLLRAPLNGDFRLSPCPVSPAIDAGTTGCDDQQNGLGVDMGAIETPPFAVPTLTVSPDNAVICTGAVLTLTASSGFQSYLWSTGETSQQISVTAGGAYSVEAVFAPGCSFTASSTVTLNAGLSPDVTVASTSDVVCIGSCATLTASGATSYVWSPATALSATTGAEVVACPTRTTTYTVTGTTPEGCSDTETITVDVQYYPASKRSNIWYFGNMAGADFNTTPSTFLLDGAVNTLEGVATIADENGALLFYTDGIRVWNRNHIIMPNGTGLMGDPSTTQSGVIVPWPNEANRYILFTADNNAEVNGFRYSILDMTLNGGLGDVTVKNTLLFAPSVEKITAVGHANGVDFWVLAHGWNDNTFYAYQVTPAGVNPVPVITSIGAIYQGLSQNAIGQMKVSSDGTLLVSAVFEADLFEVFDFDNASGLISNLRTISGVARKPYGVEFSPDNTKLYIGYYDAISNGLYQFDLINPTVASMFASRVKLSDGVFASLQLGADGGIYCARLSSTTLDVVRYPNESAVGVGYSAGAFSLGGRTSQAGLPNFVQSFFKPFDPQITPADTTICVGDWVTFRTNVLPGLTYRWQRNGADLSGETGSMLLTDQPGDYRVYITNEYGCLYTTTAVLATMPTPNPSVLASPTLLCPQECSQLFAGGADFVTWTPSVGLSSNTIFNPTACPPTSTVYTLTLTNTNGCERVTTMGLGVSRTRNSERANVWQFGSGAGVDFNDPLPVTIAGGQTTGQGGTAVACDDNGDLLFYSDANQIWTRTHALMPSGSGLSGNSAAAQAAVTVPQPGSAIRHYLFYLGAGGTGGLRYAIIDMALNAGLGDAVSTNTNLAAPMSEHLAVVPHSNGTDWWIIVHGWNNSNFLVYRLTAAGVGAPLVSTAGSFVGGVAVNAAGQLAVSPTGQLLAMAVPGSNAVDVLSFDPSTGLVSTLAQFTGLGLAGTPYGVAWSTDGTRIFVSSLAGGLTMLDLMSGGSEAAIVAARTDLTTEPVGALQQGPDGNIWGARPGQNHIGIVYDPNGVAGGPEYASQGLSLGAATSQKGLPTVSVDFYRRYDPLVQSGFDSVLCLGEETNLTLQNHKQGLAYSWQKNGEDIGSGTSLMVSETGYYRIVSQNADGCRDTSAAVEVVVRPLPTLDVTGEGVVCQGIPLSLTVTGADQYVWEPTDGLSCTTCSNPLVSPSANTTYTITGTNTESGCVSTITASVKVNNDPPAQIQIGQTTFCQGTGLQAMRGVPSGGTFAGPGVTQGRYFDPDAAGAGTHTIVYSGTRGGCSFSTQIQLTVRDVPQLTVSVEMPSCATCTDGQIQLSATGGTPNYQYSLNSTPFQFNGLFTGMPAGDYRANVLDANGCLGHLSFTINSPQESCPPPTTLTFWPAQPTLFFAIWPAVSGASGYVLQWRQVGQIAWNTTALLTSPLAIVSGLTELTSYEVQVQTVCPSGSLGPVSSVFTTTTGGGIVVTPCLSPQVLEITVQPTSALVTWADVPGADLYMVQYRQQGSTVWRSVQRSVASVLLPGLTSGTTYQIRVRARCSGLWQAWPAPVQFVTLPGRLAEELTETEDWLVYPNPTQNFVFVQSPKGTVVELYDAIGKRLKQWTVAEETPTRLELDGVASGAYVMVLRSPQRSVSVRLLVD